VKISRDEAKLKSWILLLSGLVGIGYEQYTGKVNWILLLIFTTMTGVPGLASIISLLRNSPIVIQSSLSQQEPLVRELDNSSDTSGAE
jgi:hypothetical protein